MKRLLLLAGVMELGLSLIVLSYVYTDLRVLEPLVLAEEAGSTNPAVVEPPAPPRPGLPKKLLIPRISVQAPLSYVGLTAEGEMDVKKKPDDVGWYSLGSRPGAVGAAVMAGHSGWRDNIHAVFDNLDQLQPGDEVMVEDDQGVLLTFIVNKIRRYDPDADATEVFNPNDGKKHLNLITCKGTWDSAVKSYSQRLVVFAEQSPDL